MNIMLVNVTQRTVRSACARPGATRRDIAVHSW